MYRYQPYTSRALERDAPPAELLLATGELNESIKYTPRRMKRTYYAFLLSIVLLMGACGVFGGSSGTDRDPPFNNRPIALHPENPHYFLFRDRPTVLITSAEHYGAVINDDFDYVAYLNELQSHGFNFTRVFSGPFVSPVDHEGWIGYADPLAPRPGDLVAPWARSSTEGYRLGGNRFDLGQWNPDYFARLKDYVAEASRRGIVVEVVLFCAMYDESFWSASPMHPDNQINRAGEVAFNLVHTMDNDGLLEYQEALVRKIVTELNAFDNVIYEVMNEPYKTATSRVWHDHAVDTIVEAEGSLPRQHLIAENVANYEGEITDPHDGISILNFHYAEPVAVDQNYDLNLALGDDETGFQGTGPDAYRVEGWNFMMAGGAIFDNLDYSFTPEHPDGTGVPLPEDFPSGGGPELRRQLSVLKDFMFSLDFIEMRPTQDIIVGAPDGTSVRALVEDQHTYAFYVVGGPQANLELALPAGTWEAKWLSTASGETVHSTRFTHTGGVATLDSPSFDVDVALRVDLIE
jgi:hypothetical protein